MQTWTTGGRRISAVALVLAGITVAASGCGLAEQQAGQQAEQQNEERSAEIGQTLEAEVPDLIRAAGWSGISTLRETSCLGTPDPERAPRKTRWTAASVHSDVPRAEAEHTAGLIRTASEQQGWRAVRRGAAPNSENPYAAEKDDLMLNVVYSSGTGRPELSVRFSTPCLDLPPGHTMVRSELDPMYGSPDPLYPDDDRSKFTNGTAKPLPPAS